MVRFPLGYNDTVKLHGVLSCKLCTVRQYSTVGHSVCLMYAVPSHAFCREFAQVRRRFHLRINVAYCFYNTLTALWRVGLAFQE